MRNLLIVDPCEQTRLVLKPLLEEQGYSVSFVSSAVEGLGALWEKTFAAILVDTTDEALGGEALLLALAAADPEGRQRRLAFVEDSEEAKRERVLQAGAAAVLSKPINFHDLTMVLSQQTAEVAGSAR